MDGTILDQNSNVPRGFEQLIGQLLDKNIRFSLATGRHLVELQNFFPDIIDKIHIISQNGAMIYGPGLELLGTTTMPRDAIESLLSRLDIMKNIITIMYSTEEVYVLHPTREEMSFVRAHNIVCSEIDDFHPVSGNLCKLTLADYLGQLDIEKLKKEFKGQLNFASSGKNLIDVFDARVNKGRALRFIQERHAISAEHSMAFGDAENDYELLLSVEHSMAMGNASEKILSIAKHVVPSNKEHGVLKTIKRVIEGEY